MKKLGTFLFAFVLVALMLPTSQAQAESYYSTPYYYYGTNSNGSHYGSEQELVQYLLRLIAELQAEIQRRHNDGYYDNYDDNGRNYVGKPRSGSSSDDEPDVETLSPRNIEDDEAELRGEVDMNDFNNGEVFFVYGEDEDQIEDVEDDFDSYSDVDEDGDDLQKIRVDSDLDSDEEYERRVTGLDEDTDYYYQICVGYEDDDDDEVLECGGVEEFNTDDDGGSSNDDEPDIETDRATNIEDDEARLRGEVDMNDFEDGRVFFVYGEDEDQVEDIEDDYDTYSEIDEDGDDLQKILVDNNVDNKATFSATVRGLDDDTEHFFQACVEYEDDDNDDVILCGGVEDFRTDD